MTHSSRTCLRRRAASLLLAILALTGLPSCFSETKRQAQAEKEAAMKAETDAQEAEQYVKNMSDRIVALRTEIPAGNAARDPEAETAKLKQLVADIQKEVGSLRASMEKWSKSPQP